jgi:replication factor C small subunit
MAKNKGLFRFHTDFWVEKYRPQKLDDYLGNALTKEKFKEYLEHGLNANLLLSGEPGVGKSTFAHIFVSNFDCDFKYINASDENSIDVVRTKITDFCVISGFSTMKILVLDEFGSFTTQGQLALKSVMEQYTKNTRFILTCNEIENVNEAIKSRCQHFVLNAPEVEVVKEWMTNILRKENVSFEEEEVDIIIQYSYPDMRQILNDLQRQTVKGVLKLDKEYFRLLNYQNNVVEILSKTTKANMFEQVTKIRQLIADARIKKFNRLFKHLFSNIEKYAKKDAHVTLLVTLGKYSYQDKDAPDKEINLVACLVEMAEILASV